MAKRGPIRWMAVTDPHGDMGDKAAIKAAREFHRQFKPELRFHLGDNYDFRWLRSKANDQELMERIESDVDAGHEFLNWYKPTHFLFGNHDHRIVKATDSNNGALVNLASRILTEIHEILGNGCRIYPYCKRKGVMQSGDMRAVHGYASGMYAAKKHAEAYGNVIFGHIHSVDSFTIPRLEPCVGRSIGALCLLDMGYNEAHLNTLRQEHGFAYGLQFHDGTNAIYQARPINGRWYFPTEFREVRHAAGDEGRAK